MRKSNLLLPIFCSIHINVHLSPLRSFEGSQAKLRTKDKHSLLDWFNNL